MATVFPEFAGDDGTERLWDFLLSPYDRYPPAEKLYQKALELALSEKKKAKTATPVPETVIDETPF